MSRRVVGLMWSVALLAACQQAESRPGGGAGGGGPRAMAVDVAASWSDTVVETIAVTGEIEAVQSIELRPEVEGRLVRIIAREGTEVSRGTPLFKIDDAELRAQVARLEAEHDLAQQALARTRALIRQNASSEADLEQALANARSARAQLDLTRIRLERTVVRAPFSGVVGQRFVSLGDYVTTSTRLTTLQTVDPQRASFQVPERYAPRLEVGQEVTFAVAAVPDREFTGVVDFVDPVVQLPARVITVKAEVPNPDRTLRSGMFIEAKLVTAVRPDAVVIPEDAVLPLESTTYVWVVADSTVSRREVQLGVRRTGVVEVVRGLEAGEEVVVGGLERLGEGTPVIPNYTDRGGNP